jgi:hypothetical protein
MHLGTGKTENYIWGTGRIVDPSRDFNERSQLRKTINYYS